MAKVTKTIAEERLAALELKKVEELEDQEDPALARKTHIATLKARRLEKEAAERAAKKLEDKPKKKTK